MNQNLRAAILSVLLLAGGSLSYAETVHAQSAVQEYQVAAGDLDDVLTRFASQYRLQLIYSADLVAGKRSPGLTGSFSSQDALQRLVEGSGLAWRRVDARTYVLQQAQASKSAPAQPQSRAVPAQDENKVVGMPAIMVHGTRTLNMDITRTRDDPQPYVVFDREQIERSGATSLEQFLQQRLTMNTSVERTGSGLSTSRINLRGLGDTQTLILIDGRRVSSPALSSGAGLGVLGQADITGIPLAAIDRIEVLPTTASGIYGGSATGGVINIIMRRDYSGIETKVTYDNTFDTDTATRKLDFTSGFSFNESRTSLLLTGSYSDANELLQGDRTLARRSRETIWRNNPAYFLSPNNPPLGATPNISSVDGSNLVLRDGTALNASFTSVPRTYAGLASDGGAALVANAGAYNWDLADSAQYSSSGSGRRQALYTQPEAVSASLALRHDFDGGLQLFSELSAFNSTQLYRHNGFAATYTVPANAPTNPFSQAVRVSLSPTTREVAQSSTSKHRRALAGLIKKLPKNWQVGLDYAWDESAVAFSTGIAATSSFAPAIATGLLNVFRDTSTFPLDTESFQTQAPFTSPFRTTMRSTSLRISGPLAEWAGGPLVLSALLEHRHEGVDDMFYFQPAFNRSLFYPARDQRVRSAYLELRAPLFSEVNARPGLRSLELQVALRRDDYASNSAEQLTVPGVDLPSPLPIAIRGRSQFQSVDPTIAIRWEPGDSLALRASYGTGFVPPGLDNLVPSFGPAAIADGSTDPLRGNTLAGPFSYALGGSSDIQPEKSKSWSAGLVLTPQNLPGFRLSVDYTHIRKIDNIAYHPNGFQGLIDNEALFPGRIVRGQNLPGDQPGWAGPIIFIDSSVMNLSRAELEAWDMQLDFRKETNGLGAFDLYLLGTWQPHYRIQVLSSQPALENAGISSSNPLEFKINAGVVWNLRNWKVGWNARYFDSYMASTNAVMIANQGTGGRVPSQIYHDAFASYDFGLGGQASGLRRLLESMEVQIGIRNIFNKEPPFDVGSGNGLFRGYSSFGDPRLASYYVVVKNRF